MQIHTQRVLVGLIALVGALLLLPTTTFAAQHETPTRSQCTGAAIPPGWIIIAHTSDWTRCGGIFFQSDNAGNMETIAPPPTTSTTICEDSPIPIGFVMKAMTVDHTCAIIPWLTLNIVYSHRITIAPQGPPLKPYSQLIGYDPAAQGCTTNTTIRSQGGTDILDSDGNTLGTVTMLQANDCNMYYGQVSSETPQRMHAVIGNATTAYQGQTVTDITVLSPMIKDTLRGKTCVTGVIQQAAIEYSASVCLHQ